MSKEEKWYEYPLSIFETCDAMLGMKRKLWGDKNPWAKEAGFKQSFLADTEHLHVMEYEGGVDDSHFLFRTRASKKEGIDYLGNYLPEAGKRGLKTFVYFNVHHLTSDFSQAHPDWIQYNREGDAIQAGYGSGNLVCVNTPWREWSFQIIQDLAQYEIDGIFLDGPIVNQKGCYCSFCRDLFKKGYNFDLPESENWSSTEWRNFIEFRYESTANYLKDARKALKSVRPDAIIYVNSNHLLPGWTTARDNRRLVKHQDILAAEGGFIFYSRPMDIPLWKPGATAKLLETQSGGKPRVVFLCGNHKPWDRYLLPPTEIKLLYAETIANGANPWFAIIPENPDGLHLKGTQTGREMSKFIAEHREYYIQTSSSAGVALVWSLPTEDYYGSAVDYTDFSSEQKSMKNIGDSKESFQGYYEALVRSHIPFDVVDDYSLKDGTLEKYEAVILPNIACISPEGSEGIKKYITNGGGIVAVLETSLYNQYGEKQQNFQLTNVLGIDYAQGCIGPLPYDYISITKEHPVTGDIEQKLIPAPGYGVKTTLKGAESLANFHEKLPARYVSLPDLSGYTAVTVNNYGKGKAVYLGGNFAEHYWTYRIPEHRQLLSNAVRWLSEPMIELERAPQTLEVVVRKGRDKKKIIIHLINFSAEMCRPMTGIIPCQDVKVRIKGIIDAHSVKTLWFGKELQFKRDKEGIVFFIPEIKEYEVVVVE